MSRGGLAAIALALALAVLVHGTVPARAEGAAPDSLSDFLKGLADSTDASYGMKSVSFDTTGIDSLAANAILKPPRLGRRGSRLEFAPLVGYHRAEGFIAGATARVGTRRAGWLRMTGTYGFDNQGGRYAFEYHRVLLYHGPRRDRSLREPGRIYEGATRLDLELGYARTSEPFLPEQASRRLYNLNPVWNGHSSSSLYERRGVYGSLTYWTHDWRFVAGARDVIEDPMIVVSTWTLFGSPGGLPTNLSAVREDYTEPFGSVGFWRSDWELGALLEARGGGADRWRMRGALAKAFRLGPAVKTTLQFEAGATAANAPAQRRFGLGGPYMVPTMQIETGSNDHLLAGKMETIEAHDLLRAIRLPHPDWFVVQPAIMADAGASWNDNAGRDVLFAKPPGTAWRASMGAGLVWRIGVPEPDVLARMYVTWPVGPDAGTTQYRFTVGKAFSLLGNL